MISRRIMAVVLGLMWLMVASSPQAAVCTVNNGLIAPPNSNIQLNGVAGNGGTVIGVGQNNAVNNQPGVIYINGTAVTLPNNTPQMNAVAMASPTYAVAVGENGGLIQLSNVGGTWTATSLATPMAAQDLYAVTTFGPNQTYVGGKQGIFFFNGSVWAQQSTIQDIMGMWSNGTTLFAVSLLGQILQKPIATPPSTWTTLVTLNNPVGAKYAAITGDAAGNLYLTGASNNGNTGFIAKISANTGLAQTNFPVLTNAQMSGIAVNPATGVITAVGDANGNNNANAGIATINANGTGLTQPTPAANSQQINGIYIAPNGTTYMAGVTASGCTAVPPVGAGLDHIRITHTGTALTCSPQTVTLDACADAACATLYTTGGVSVTLSPGGQTFTIGTTGTNAVATVSQATAGTATLATTTVTPATVGATTCVNGAGTSCAMTFSNAGFVITVPNHTACSTATATIEAVQTGGTGRCVPAYQNVTRPVNLYSAYANPATGTQAITASTGQVSTAAPGSAHSLAFDSTGKATITLTYPDAGQLSLNASDTAPTGATMTGSGTFIAAPASFILSGIPAAPINAGQAFNTTVTAMNACAVPAATPNFNGTVTLASSNPLPALGNGTAISTPASAFSNGVSSTNLVWNEVGTIDLSASMSSYLGWALATPVTGTLAAVGRFHPAYFVTTATPACGAFTYAGSTTPLKAGQPFSVTATTYAATGNVTKNYAGSANAYSTTLSNAGITTGFAGNSIAAASFVSGVGTASSVTYAVAAPQTMPVTLQLRAADADVSAVSSVGHEATMSVLSGRAKLVNSYGSELQNMAIPFTTEFYSATGQWQTNNLDSCTVATLPTLTLQPSGTVVAKSFNSPFVSGQGNLLLNAPNAAGEVSLLPSVNTWLQYVWTGTTLSSPSARATFGVYTGNKTFIYHGRRGR